MQRARSQRQLRLRLPPRVFRWNEHQTATAATVATTQGAGQSSDRGGSRDVSSRSARSPRSRSAREVVAVTLTDGLPFRIALMEDVPLDTEVGRTIHFRVVEGLQGGPATVIAKGSIVTGVVAALGGKRNFFGERSKARFRLISAVSVDDGKIELRATPAARDDGAETRPFATPSESAHDLKDKNLIAASGTEYIAYVSGEQTVNVHK